LKKDVYDSTASPTIDALTQPAFDAVDSFVGWVNDLTASVYVDAYGPGTEYAGGSNEASSDWLLAAYGTGTEYAEGSNGPAELLAPISPNWLPYFAEGGIVTAPILAALAENNRPEAIIPLDQITKIIGGGGNTYNITVNGGGNAEEIARAIRNAIENYDRSKNRSGAYA